MKRLKIIIRIILITGMALMNGLLYAQTMVVNEIMFKPGPSTSGCDQKMYSAPSPACGREYIELFNSDCSNDYDLSGYVLASCNVPSGSLGNGGAICFPQGTIVPAGSFLTIGGPDEDDSNNGTYAYQIGSIDFKIPTYAGTQYLCLNTANTYWFLGNIDGWMALYEPSGNVHSAVYWSSSASNITSVADFDNNPCSPSAYTGPTLKSAKQIYQSTPSLIQYMGNPSSTSTGNTFSRVPDGGTWQGNYAPTVGPLRTDRCNDGQCLACGNLVVTMTPDTCSQSNGTITATVANQTTSPPPYTYTVTGPVNLGPTTTSTNPYVFTNLPAGAYTVTVVDNFSPPNTTTKNITVTATGSLSLTTSSTSATCGLSDGSATANPSGSGPFTYAWSTSPSQTTQTATNIPAGTYTVSVSGGGCSSTASVTVQNTGGVTASTTTQSATCNQSNGSATVNASGGTGSYTYNWNTTPAQTTSTASNIPAGTYTVTVTSGSCTATATATVQNANGPTVTPSGTDATCGNSNGSASVNVTGGTGTYTYSWSNGGNTASISSLSPGTYTVTVSDGVCTMTSNVTIQNIGGPTINATATDATCGNNNGTTSVVASGGTGTYTYSWSNGGNSASLSNLAPGTYTVTVSDGGPCPANTSVTVNAITGPSITSVTSTNENCDQSDGTATVAATGGSGTYTYSWSNGQTSATATNLSAGTYLITVSDGGPCPATGSVSVNNIPGPSIQFSITDAHCGQADGSVNAIITGGTGSYTMNWSTTPPVSGTSISSVTSGNYTITVQDGNCTVSQTAVIDDIPGPDADFSTHPPVMEELNPSCSFIDQSTGSVNSWTWDFGDNSSLSNEQNPSHSYPAPGTYFITLVVTDDFGCTSTTTDSVTVKELVTLYIPNAFSPDGDGINEVFQPQGIGQDGSEFDMQIFDRWGNLVFQTNNLDEGWDGKTYTNGLAYNAPIDVYVYRIYCKPLSEREQIYIGSITLLR